jgi:hypothetical protein
MIYCSLVSLCISILYAAPFSITPLVGAVLTLSQLSNLKDESLINNHAKPIPITNMVAGGRDHKGEPPPWLALIEDFGPSAAGVLLSSKVLLTAAHVTPTSTISSCRIDSSTCLGAVKFRVEKVISHPGYVNNKTHTV